ncbi:hypothetical protein BJV82DRAFT_380217 [Fennellomyces sp. T-0311]|nr:hypothetical protein BJV82DRAFT_380217 [Fennellomyces sp. T-0311]
MEIETNKAISSSTDMSASYSRKIDLLLKCDDKRAVELSSNEWKRAAVTNATSRAQQCKNLRVNAAILNNTKKYGITQTAAMDFTGNSGYFYILKWSAKEDIFVATSSNEIHVTNTSVVCEGYQADTWGVIFL